MRLDGAQNRAFCSLSNPVVGALEPRVRDGGHELPQAFQEVKSTDTDIGGNTRTVFLDDIEMEASVMYLKEQGQAREGIPGKNKA